jgi:RNA polymerase sigma-70 factor (ECF subfamily)
MANDRELLEQLQAGSLEALGELYDHHQRMVYRTALAITGDAEAAADLLQDVFLRLHRFAERVDPNRPLEPWLFRVTTNLAYTHVKRSHRWLRPLEEVTEWLAGVKRNAFPAAMEMEDDWHLVQQALGSLPLPQRIVVVLYYIDGLSLQEIAEILDVPAGTVKSRLHYGREALKKQLGLIPTDRLSDLQCDFT